MNPKNSVQKFFEENEVEISGHRLWKEIPLVQANYPGVYIISIPSPMESPSINDDQIKCWLNTVFPGIEKKEMEEKIRQIHTTFKIFWSRDETIVYIGKTNTTIRKRLNEFYRHRSRIGKESPHKGGEWLLTLNNLDEFDVYWAEIPIEPEKIETKMLQKFVGNIIQKRRIGNGVDKAEFYPFANKTGPYHHKKHGLTFQKKIK